MSTIPTTPTSQTDSIPSTANQETQAVPVQTKRIESIPKRSQLPNRPIPTNSSSQLPKILIGSVIALALLAATAWGIRSFIGSAEVDDTLTHTVERTNVRITVSERGNLESQKTVDGVCELSGYQNKIIFIVDEGEMVEKDEVVVRFDSAEIDKESAQVEIQVNTAKSRVETSLQEVEVKANEGDSLIAAADLELTLADLDLKKYIDGDYKVEYNKLKGLIALAEVELEKANDQYENTKMLVKKGFREPEQLRGAEQQVEYAKYSLARDKETLEVLNKFGERRQRVELKAKFEEAGRKLERSKKTKAATVAKAMSEHESAKAELAIVERELAEWKDQREKCVIKAKQSGVLAYANEEWYSSDRRIREGAVVHRRQKIFSLPNLNLMQVKVNVHESVVKKVTEGQHAMVRVDAFPNEPMQGVVKTVSQLADSSNSWSRGGVKEYATIVTLDGTSKVAIKPGMNAEVEIRVDHLIDVMAVPVQAVSEHKHHHFVYVKQGKDFVRRDVEIGQSNNRMVEIKSGLEVSEEVALDARARGIIDFEDEKEEFEADEVVQEDAAVVAASDASTDSTSDKQVSKKDNETEPEATSEEASAHAEEAVDVETKTNEAAGIEVTETSVDE